ncbi:bacteriohemerythrin [bacterium]|nr:bacteriohemerythrin [bacterium]
MALIRKINVSSGIYWIEIPAADLYLLCGCPADSVKHLMKKGLIKTEERNGVSFETGPNAILLSDILVQNGHFSNLSEFPVLQMLYRQGLIIPNHPNNTGQKPILIGSREQVISQMRYIYRGNYGLISSEEISRTGISPETTREMMKIKTRFAFGQIKPSREFLDNRIVEQEPVEILSQVFIKRLKPNVFEISYRGETVLVDLNMAPDQNYEVPYPLNFHLIEREYFSVIHSGEGDGWDVNRPCMASILMFQGRTYLIDAGPNILGTLVSLGINISEVEGIFHTHSHDDHFAGLPSLIRSDHRLKYYSTPLVRSAVTKKLAALLSIEEDQIAEYFEFNDLQFDVWNQIDGLEVKPLYSPHPVENNIFIFRTIWEAGYRTYGHFADIVAFDVFDKMAVPDKHGEGISKSFLEKIKADYSQPCQIKKLDIGGGMIHGKAIDFIDDTSDRIILSHSSSPLKDAEKEIGSEATFGAVDVLIPASQNYAWRYAHQFLHSYFPDVPTAQIRILLNNPIVNFNPGTILLKEGEKVENIYLVLTGNVELIQSKHSVNHVVSSGELVGEIPALNDECSNATFRAVSFVQVLKLTHFIYLSFVEYNSLHEGIKELQKIRRFLRKTTLFGESISYTTQNRIAQSVTLIQYEKGVDLSLEDNNSLYIVKEGELEFYLGEKIFEKLKSRDFFGQESIIFGIPCLFHLRTTTESELFQIPGEMLKDIPVVRWKLFEAYEKRIQLLNSCHAGISLFQWRSEYSVNIQIMDNQHQKLFSIADKMCKASESDLKQGMIAQVLSFLIKYANVHFKEEEALMKLYEYPETDIHCKLHQGLIQQINEFETRIKQNTLKPDHLFPDFFRHWIIKHILTEDRKYSRFLNDKGVF